jgi:N-acetylglucosaminyldiphosphoundecaprenol N-acetyl-beta-D-mannosaminyltransferase
MLSIEVRNRKTWLACLNPHSYVTATRDQEFSIALRRADWLVADGTGILLGSKLLRTQLTQRVSGPDVFLRLNARLDDAGGRIFFLGSSPDTLKLMTERMNREHPRVEVVGTYSPPYVEDFSQKESLEMIRAVNATRPDALWVAMTAPKQEKWLARHREALEVPFAAAVGAVFDFYAMKIPRLGWFPRLLTEPRRLWPRTFISGPLFIKDVVRERLR